MVMVDLQLAMARLGKEGLAAGVHWRERSRGKALAHLSAPVLWDQWLVERQTSGRRERAEIVSERRRKMEQ